MKKIDLVSKLKTTASSTITSGLLNNEGIKENILILPALKELIKPLSSDEYDGLKQNILQNGCQDSLKIWQTTQRFIDEQSETDEEVFVLIDGHNRHQICKETNTPFNITLMKFESLDSVKDWMVLLQLNRRNVSPNELSYYRGLLYRNALKEDASNMDAPKSDEQTVKKSVQLAQKFKVDEKTIRRDGDFSDGINNLSDELKKDVLAGNVRVPKQKVQDLAKVQVENKINTLEELNNVLESSKEVKKNTKKEKIDPEVEPTGEELSGIVLDYIETSSINDFTIVEPTGEELATTDKIESLSNFTKEKATVIPSEQRENLVKLFEKFMETERKEDLTDFQKGLKLVDKLLK